MKRAVFALLALAAACAAPPAPPEGPPAPDLALQGTRWLMAMEGAAASTRAPTLEFGAEGRAGGFSGCNQWFAQVERSNGGLQFSAVGMTRRACEEAVMRIEQDFAASLAKTRSARRDGDELVLLDENAQPLARFTPAN